MNTIRKAQLLQKRRWRIRKKVNGTAARPRLSVRFTMKHIYAQAIDDASGTTVAHVSTTKKGAVSDGTKSDDAKKIGAAMAQALIAKGIKAVVFDRNGYLYHGRVRALADGAREGGLKF